MSASIFSYILHNATKNLGFEISSAMIQFPKIKKGWLICRHNQIKE